MSTHNILFLPLKKEITINYPKSAAIGFFTMDTRTSSNRIEFI